MRNTYIVGGAVRDHLLGVKSNDTDYVVVNSTVADMLDRGFTSVGKDFPVFLHPETQDEYALARRERSTGPSYNDFEVETNNVTLEEDLLRRDLTINSIAMALDGTIIDPYNGQADIKNKVLRHTSEAFKEDPLRVLRLARFRANLGYEWKIAYDTKALVSKTWTQLSSLQPDRVWKEIEKVKDLRVFFETLFELGVLDLVFPHIYELTTCKEGSKYHMEPSVFVHTMMMLDILKDQPMRIKMAALYHDIAKPFTYMKYGCSRNHADLQLIEDRLDIQIPTKMRKQVLFMCENHVKVHQTHEMSDKTLAKWLRQFKSLQQLRDLLILSHADDEGRVALTEKEQLDDAFLLAVLTVMLSYSPAEWILKQESPPNGETIKQHIHKTNISFVRYYRKRYALIYPDS